MIESFAVLIISSISIAFFHSLAPDHWMPFAVLGHAQKWSRRKLLWITFFCGVGHVGSSVAFGIIGILLGITLFRLEGVEAFRGQIVLLLLIGFGIAYAIWGLKHARSHRHFEDSIAKRKFVTFWTLFALFVLGPCEPLIPLIFLGIGFGWNGVFMVGLSFSIVTIGMMMSQSFLAFSGANLLKLKGAEKYTHTIAGGVIALTGAFVLVAGV